MKLLVEFVEKINHKIEIDTDEYGVNSKDIIQIANIINKIKNSSNPFDYLSIPKDTISEFTVPTITEIK